MFVTMLIYIYEKLEVIQMTIKKGNVDELVYMYVMKY
jgi:hypothetical protein